MSIPESDSGKSIVQGFRLVSKEVLKLISKKVFERVSQEVFRHKNLEGCSQVTSVPDKMSVTDELSDILPDNLAGASPHAPDPPSGGKKRIKKKKNYKGHRFCLRMPEEMWERLREKTTALETYPSSQALELIAADLGLPTDDYRATRNKYLKKAFADLRIAFDDCGVNINQMAEATNSGKPCPLTRPEINKALADFVRGCRALESLRP